MTKQQKTTKQRYKDLSYFKPKLCPFCKSKKIIKWGFRYNHVVKKRRYMCNECNKLFTVDDGFWKKKKQREFITQCIDLYVNGMSLRKVKAHMEQFTDKKISHTAIMKWLRSYSKAVKIYTDKLPIEISGLYHADELFVKCGGMENYFWDLIDAESRFLVATHYSMRRDIDSATILLNNAKMRAEKPLQVVTDGLQAYVNTVPATWYKNTYKDSEQVKHIRTHQPNDYRNNIIERIQGTIRERIKVMRGFKNNLSAKAILDLFTIYYNFIRIHQGIGMTPAEACGIKLALGQNRWLGLIYASKIN